MSYAIAKNELEGVWRVYCNVCRKDMGTMTVNVLKEALVFAVEKGGVMCPECRSGRCIKCGLKPSAPLTKRGWCWFCERDEESLEDSCLVNQNSRIAREGE